MRDRFIKFLADLDNYSHKKLDGYIDAQKPFWGTLQLLQNKLCNYYEKKADMV